jgi:hypothetical protein
MGDALRVLIAGIESAAGPDADIDRLISHFVVYAPQPEFHLRLSLRDKWTAPAYTASLDAALLLVPEGWQDCWTLEGRFCWLRRLTAEGVDEVQTEAATPALALTAAALRARLAMEERK